MKLKSLALASFLTATTVPAQAVILADFTAGTLTLTLQSEALVAVACSGSDVAVNGNTALTPATVPCAGVLHLSIQGDATDNVIDLGALAAPQFSTLAGTTLTGGAGVDTVTGSFAADSITGGPGADDISAAAGDDRVIWNPGDGTDRNDGGEGSDRIVVQGGSAADPFLAGPNVPGGPFFGALAQPGFSVLFVRNPGFSIAIRNAEVLEVNGLGGDDNLDGSALAAGLIALELNGGDNNDTVIGSSGADLLTGGPGNDSIDANPGLDSIDLGDGDDSNTWNNGDGTDAVLGGIGNDRQIVNGATAGDVFTVVAGTAPVNVRFDRTNLVPFGIDLTAVETLEVNGLGGDDNISAGTLAAGLIALELNGGDNNDTVIGSSGADLLTGGLGNDSIDANPGLDSIDLGDGDDNNTWNNGDGTDAVLGGIGNDRQIVNGATAGDVFTVVAGTAPVNVRFDRTNLVPFGIDLTAVETLEVNGLGGDDNISAGTLTAGLIALELNGGDNNDSIVGSQGADLISGGPGNDVLDGSDNPIATVDRVLGGDDDDIMTWNPGKDDDINIGGPGNDLSLIVGGGAGEQFFIREEPANSGMVRFERTTAGGAAAAFFVDITETELLRLNANGGNDSVDATTLRSGLIQLELNGGDGDDTLLGSAGADRLDGGNNNDNLRAGPNPPATQDRMTGGIGNDLLTWNPGDGDDLNEGGGDVDTLLVNGAGASEQFRISAVGARFLFVRLQPTVFTLDSVDIEDLQLNATGGDDLVETQPLAGVQQLLDGGPALTALADRLRIGGTLAAAATSPVLTPGFGAITHLNFESSESTRSGGSFSALLNGAQEVPPVTTPASGRGTVVLNADETEITVRLSFANLGSVSTMAHIHGPAAPGSNAPPIFNLTGLGGISADLGPAVFQVTPQQVNELRAGLWYFNVHSQLQPNGEIRGQILLDQQFDGPLEGRQVVPRTETQARGYVTARLAGSLDQVFLTLVYTGLTGEGVPGASVDVGIFGPARRGANGTRIATITLPINGLAADQFIAGPFAVTAQQAQDLANGLWYVQVASQEFPQGEIRGQITSSLFFDNFE